MELRLQKLVCLNEVAIPFQESVLTVMHDDELEANVELLLLPLHVNTDKMAWLLKAYGLEKKWHRVESNWAKVAFINEILVLITNQKAPKRGAKWPNVVIQIKFRGKVLLVKKQLKSIDFGFQAR